MKKSRTQTIGKCLKRLKKAHFFWTGGNLEYKDRLEQAIDPTIVRLEKLGVPRRFSEALLFFGKEFADSIKNRSDSNGRSDELDKFESVSTQDIEKIFNSKVGPMGNKEKREFVLAEKYRARVYESVPMEGGKVSIKVLLYKLDLTEHKRLC